MNITAGRMVSLSAWVARLQAGDLQLQLHLHQVQAAHHLRDAVLHLHARAAITLQQLLRKRSRAFLQCEVRPCQLSCLPGLDECHASP